MKIACVGECTVDQYLDLADQGRSGAYVGGISLNFAVHSKRSGAEQVSLISCIGTDSAGQTVLARLVAEGVDASHLSQRPGRTAEQQIRLLDNGERIFPPGGFTPGVLARYRLSRAEQAFIAGHDILVGPLYAQIEPLFEQAMTDPAFSGRRVADFLDGSDYPDIAAKIATWLNWLDLIFISGDDETVAALRPLTKHYPGLIVVTLGAAGSLALSRGDLYHQPALPVDRPVDTTGCGDAFQAAFTVSYFRAAQIDQALYAGARQAAQVLQHLGAIG